MSIEHNTRQAIFSELTDYCHHAKTGDFIEATTWTNGEGWDINISTHDRNEKFQLSYGEMELLEILTKLKES